MVKFEDLYECKESSYHPRWIVEGGDSFASPDKKKKKQKQKEYKRALKIFVN